jgi:hypothetical protein
VNRWITIGGVIIGLVIVAFLVATFMIPGFREWSRDVAIIVLALFQMISAVLTVGLLLALLYVAREIHRVATGVVIPKIDALTTKVDEVIDQTRTIASSARETAVSVTTTTTYVSEQVVTPVIRLSGIVAGIRAAARFLAYRDEP